MKLNSGFIKYDFKNYELKSSQKINSNSQNALLKSLEIQDVCQFSTKSSKQGNFDKIKHIQTDEEFSKILSELIKDSSYKSSWLRAENAFDYERAILPYAGRGDISDEINSYLRGKDISDIDISEEKLKKYIQVLEYGLKKLDEDYGAYNGIVYRYGVFTPETQNFVSTSDKMSGAIGFSDKSNVYKEDYNIIFTKHGHKINEMQKHLNYKFAETESEILLDPKKNFVQITDETSKVVELREKFYEEFKKIHPSCTDLDRIKLKFWIEQ